MGVAVLDVQWLCISRSSFPDGAWFALVLPGHGSQNTPALSGLTLPPSPYCNPQQAMVFESDDWAALRTLSLPSLAR